MYIYFCNMSIIRIDSPWSIHQVSVSFLFLFLYFLLSLVFVFIHSFVGIREKMMDTNRSSGWRWKRRSVVREAILWVSICVILVLSVQRSWRCVDTAAEEEDDADAAATAAVAVLTNLPHPDATVVHEGGESMNRSTLSAVARRVFFAHDQYNDRYDTMEELKKDGAPQKPSTSTTRCGCA